MSSRLAHKLDKEFEESFNRRVAERRKALDAKDRLLEQYISFSKEVDDIVVLKDLGTLTKDNVLTEGVYTYREVSIIVENDTLSGFRIVNDRRVNLFKIHINDTMDGLQLYRIVGDMVRNLFTKGDQ